MVILKNFSKKIATIMQQNKVCCIFRKLNKTILRLFSKDQWLHVKKLIHNSNSTLRF